MPLGICVVNMVHPQGKPLVKLRNLTVYSFFGLYNVVHTRLNFYDNIASYLKLVVQPEVEVPRLSDPHADYSSRTCSSRNSIEKEEMGYYRTRICLIFIHLVFPSFFVPAPC